MNIGDFSPFLFLGAQPRGGVDHMFGMSKPAFGLGMVRMMMSCRHLDLMMMLLY